MRRMWKVLAGAGVAFASAAYSPQARACGGCFIPPTQSESTVVTGHRMVVSLSPERSILWDQISYDGNPEEFAWVLPVKPGAVIEAGSDAFFEALETSTAASIVSPQLYCGSGGGGGVGCAGTTGGGPTPYLSDSAPESQRNGVSVLHKGTVGPYETVTLRSTSGDALGTWLANNNYGIDPSVEPVISQYVAEEFDFIAIKLRPGEGVDAMKPVRVVTPGSSFTFPLRMVAAGTGSKVGITLFVIGEGRWSAQGAASVSVDDTELNWDFGSRSSNYNALREKALQENNGNAWLTVHALPHVLFEPKADRTTYGAQVNYTAADGTAATTIAELFAVQGKANGETESIDDCRATFTSIARSGKRVVDLCDGETCRERTGEEIDSRGLECGALDDLAAALVGMVPANVWVTRLEADLPRSALAHDLSLTAAESQTERNNFLFASKGTNLPENCSLGGSAAVSSAMQPASHGSEQLAGLLAAFAPLAVGMTVLRRSARRKRG